MRTLSLVDEHLRLSHAVAFDNIQCTSRPHAVHGWCIYACHAASRVTLQCDVRSNVCLAMLCARCILRHVPTPVEMCFQMTWICTPGPCVTKCFKPFPDRAELRLKVIPDDGCHHQWCEFPKRFRWPVLPVRWRWCNQGGLYERSLYPLPDSGHSLG